MCKNIAELDHSSPKCSVRLKTLTISYPFCKSILYIVSDIWRNEALLQNCMCVRMYVCMYVVCICMYVHVCICMYVCMYVCLYVFMYVCMYVCMYVSMYVRMGGWVHVCTYVDMYVCV